MRYGDHAYLVGDAAASTNPLLARIQAEHKALQAWLPFTSVGFQVGVADDAVLVLARARDLYGPRTVGALRLPSNRRPVGVAVGWFGDDIVGAISGAVSDVAHAVDADIVISAIGDAAVAAARGVGDAAQAIGGAVVTGASWTWGAAGDAIHPIVSLPGISDVIHTLSDGTRILKAIVDSPITAVVVLAVATALNTVGLGGGLLAEYAAVRAGIDALVKLEDGTPIGLADIEQLGLTTVGAVAPMAAVIGAAALTGVKTTVKIANGQNVSIQDAVAMGLAGASVFAFGNPNMGRAISWMKVGAAVIPPGQPAKAGQKKMPAKLSKDNVHTAPEPVVRHLGSKIPDIAADSISRSPAGQAALLAAMRDTQAGVMAGVRVPGGVGTYAETKAAYDDAWKKAQARVNAGMPLDAATISNLYLKEDALGLPRALPTKQAYTPPVAQGSIPTKPLVHTAPEVQSLSAFMAGPNPRPPVGPPSAPPAYHLPIGYGPMNPAKDAGSANLVVEPSIRIGVVPQSAAVAPAAAYAPRT